MFCSNQFEQSDAANQRGPFRMGVVTPIWKPGEPAPDQWWVGWRAVKPRDTFSRLADGTSNQFMIGEKHIPTSVMDKCQDGANASLHGWESWEVYSADCSYLSVGVWGINSSGRAFRTWDGEKTLARGPKDYDVGATVAYVPTHHYNFGSSHPGTVNFVLGDGAVRGVSVTTPHAVLRAFAQVNDGIAVSLP
jgi:hypothetical protein